MPAPTPRTGGGIAPPRCLTRRSSAAINNLLVEAWEDLRDPQVVWQIGILLISLGLAWSASRAPRLATIEANGSWKFGAGSLARVVFPAVALIPLSLVIGAGRRWMKLDLLRLFVPILASLLLQGTFWLAITLLAALWLGGVLEAQLMRAETLHSSLRVVFSRLAKSLLLLFAVLIALPLVGIDLTVLSVFGGALGVGFGFGLQKIASNYMSGFIILLERPIRIGDLITADNFYGEVRNITTRYVVVRALDGREAIIPNEMLITTTMFNHSLSNRQVRQVIQVQVGYSSDLERAMQLMEEVARKHARVLADPAPKAFLARFADSGIELELGIWIADPENGMLSLRSDLNIALWRAFRDAGIEIPYPQREVRILPAKIGAARGF